MLRESGEECDYGETIPGMGPCSSTCRWQSGCGDGSLDSGEECDDGNNNSGDGCSAECVAEPPDCGDGVVMAAEAFDQAVQATIERLREGPTTLGELRDALGTNRRAAQAFLETLDRRGITRRDGDARVLGRAALQGRV